MTMIEAVPTVALALSGGIDSAVAAHLLQKQGLNVHGLFLKHPYQHEDETDAGKIAEFLGIPLTIRDVSTQFEAVVDDFTQEYFGGRTPNPCVLCNRMIKFGVLMDFALHELTADFYATGHYVRRSEVEGFPALLQGVDDTKDQAYVLYGIGREKLHRLLFPLGEWTKKAVRRMAAEIRLPLPDKKESQDICFVKSGCHAEFLHARRPGVDTAGRFIDTEGNVLALHGGFEQFTVGQRKGMGVGFGRRVFVLELNAETNDVVVGPWEKLARTQIHVTKTRWLLPQDPMQSLRCSVKIRYRSKAFPATVLPEGDGAVVDCDEPVFGIAPGQSAVFFDGDRLLGGGIIN